jgi:hypothetical protein
VALLARITKKANLKTGKVLRACFSYKIPLSKLKKGRENSEKDNIEPLRAKEWFKTFSILPVVILSIE